ncbi:hypothetical protein [Micromonospora ureilytica]|uniref:Lipoprotein n=1 Tax=Micromonospora ureilytica TaxID=709868 RepID=A0ABS0JUB5_9ACTN|nr:hypothetical protein [Micromonospora ureilytica]MBG6070061.1 hypothetical protein [Micromonospora ureilytica]
MIRTRLTAAALTLAVAVATAGCGGDAEPGATATSSAPSASTSTRPAAVEVECVNIDRAHNAWDGPRRAQSAAEVAGWNELDIKMAMETGEDYLKAVSGYESQPSKTLAVAIAEYNFELSLVNAEAVIGDRIGEEQAGKAAAAAGSVGDAYRAWRSATCA